MFDNKIYDILINELKNSYSPYSNFNVAAVLVTKEGDIYTGCNIENASYSATVCAERTAIFKAISEGHNDFKMIAIAGGYKGKIEDECKPCGVCLQVLTEFCDSDFKIYLINGENSYKEYMLKDFLPKPFDLN
mgnify:CR=1 FL=1